MADLNVVRYSFKSLISRFQVSTNLVASLLQLATVPDLAKAEPVRANERQRARSETASLSVWHYLLCMSKRLVTVFLNDC
jgi:hypothetical protein